MTISYPDNLDSFLNPNSSNSLSSPSHSQQHADANDAIEALQVKVGVNDSTDPNSLDYRIASLESGGGQIGVELGLTGNNDLTVTGIENKTILDSFDSNLFATVKYQLQLTRGSEKYTSAISILSDGTNLNIVESDIISNTDSTLANITFEENSGIINLCVSPVSTAVTARYYRTSLKA